jgi:large subunit ribosomal protein L13
MAASPVVAPFGAPTPSIIEQGTLVRTFSPKPADITRGWHIVDADGLVLGRLATEVASILRGKHKPTFAPNTDMGDHVIVINCDKVVLTSGKAEAKMSYRHSGYPGGLTATSYGDLMIDHADEVVKKAVTGMLPKNRLGRQMATKLKVYRGTEHPHSAQSPEPLELPGARRTASARSGA